MFCSWLLYLTSVWFGKMRYQHQVLLSVGTTIISWLWCNKSLVTRFTFSLCCCDTQLALFPVATFLPFIISSKVQIIAGSNIVSIRNKESYVWQRRNFKSKTWSPKPVLSIRAVIAGQNSWLLANLFSVCLYSFTNFIFQIYSNSPARVKITPTT